MSEVNPIIDDAALLYDKWRLTLGDALFSKGGDLRWTKNQDVYRALAGLLMASGLRQEMVQLLIDEMVRGVCISMLSILDGATKMSEEHNLRIKIDGKEIDAGSLHMDFVIYLLETGRMT